MKLKILLSFCIKHYMTVVYYQHDYVYIALCNMMFYVYLCLRKIIDVFCTLTKK